MILWTALKAAMVGISILILAQVMYIGVLVKISHYEILRLILLVSPSLAAFAAVYLSPCQKVVVGSSIAIFGTMIAMLSAVGYEYFGLHVDHIGGLMATFVILIIYHVALSTVGGLAGYFLSNSVRRIRR